MKLNIAWLYPRLMDTYGDRGNLRVLQQRCAWRGIEVETRLVSIDDNLIGDEDILLMGGAQDREQKIVLDDLLHNKGNTIRDLVNQGTPSLFVCAGYQMMGHFYQPAVGERIEGLGIFPLSTTHSGEHEPRLIGNVAISQVTLDAGGHDSIVGFENHGGRTILDHGATPLGIVSSGFGNNGTDRTEGVRVHNALGSYLHGPLLTKNPHVADFLIKTALSRKNHTVELQALDDDLMWQAHAVALSRAKKQ